MMRPSTQFLRRGISYGNRQMSSTNFTNIVSYAHLEKCNTPEASHKRILYFSAHYHVVCRDLHPFLKKVSESYPNISFLDIDHELFSKTSASYEVKLAPSFVFISGETITNKTFALRGSNEADLLKAIKALDEAA